MQRLTDEELAKEFVKRLMPIHDEVEFKLTPRETKWRQQAYVFASAIVGRERNAAFNNLTRLNKHSCVLVHDKASFAQRMHPECSEIAYGKMPRIFDTSTPWNLEKAIVFSRYKYVVVIEPDTEDPFQHLEQVMGESFDLIRDGTHFIVQNP